jgi:serpin B
MRSSLALAAASVSCFCFLLGTIDCSSGPSATNPSPAPSSSNDTTPPTTTLAKSDLARDPPSAAAIPGAVTANNDFAADLLTRVGSASPNANVLTSPLSASLALTMTYAGAKGTTASQMAAALHFGSADASIFDGQNALSQALAERASYALDADTKSASLYGARAPNPSDYAVHVVNAVWGEQSYVWERPFLDILAKSYGTGVYEIDFLHQAGPATTTINDWVLKQTAGKITNLLNPLDGSTRMVLVNAAQLKLPFASAFDASASLAGTFTRTDGTTVSPTFMHKTDSFAYADTSDAQIVKLPLAGGQLSVMIALPHGDLAAYEAALAAGSATLAVPVLPQLVDLSLPKTSFTTSSFSLKAALTAMGMVAAFDGTADFSGMCAHPPSGEHLFILDVIEKATMTVRETGIEAAASTAVIAGGDAGALLDAGPPPAPIPMNANKPYVIAIVDNPTGAILFLGHIADPTDAGGR